MNKLRLVRRKLLVRKCVTGEPCVYNGSKGHKIGLIYVTQARSQHQHWCEIIDVSNDCKYFMKDHIGWFVFLPEYSYIPKYKKDLFFRIDKEIASSLWGSNNDEDDIEDFIVKEEFFEIPHKDGGAPLMAYKE